MKNTYKFTAYAIILMTAVLPVVSHANASKTIYYCKRQYDLSTFWPQTPYTMKKCSLLFEKFTFDWVNGNY